MIREGGPEKGAVAGGDVEKGARGHGSSDQEPVDGAVADDDSKTVEETAEKEFAKRDDEASDRPTTSSTRVH